MFDDVKYVFFFFFTFIASANIVSQPWNFQTYDLCSYIYFPIQCWIERSMQKIWP